MRRKVSQKEIDHINEHGKKCIQICIQQRLWDCGDANCTMHVFWNGFTDAEIDASVKLLSRFVHDCKDADTIKLFSHLVGEQQRRKFTRNN